MSGVEVSHKRFVVLGGPGGYLVALPAGDPRLLDKYRRWAPLVRINHPMTPELVRYAYGWVLRHYELVPAARELHAA